VAGATSSEPYYRRDLALVHHLGFADHADTCAPGILALLEPVRARGGLVVELGCGSGALTRHLVAAGHRVVATDASAAMLDLACENAPGVEDLRLLVLPDDDVPRADAIVSVGHVISYLPDEPALDRALVAVAGALAPDGVLAIDVCDLEYGARRRGAPPAARVGDDWAVITCFSTPSPERFVRDITTFVHNGDGSWRRSDERHDNVLVETDRLPALLAEHGVDAEVRASFDTETLPPGLRVVVGRRRS
jgi:SAM-dependent methyltransferase